MRRAALALAVAAGLGSSAPAAGGQSLLERTPNLGGAWVGESGTLHFHFLHRFQATDAPTRKVTNSPTFLLAAGLPGGWMAGARYATASLVRPGFPNEWEAFARWATRGPGGVDVGLHGGWNQAAASADAELSAGARAGPVRFLGAVRGFSDAYHAGEARAALAGGLTLRLHEWVALALDGATLLERTDAEEAAWGVGLQLRIPYTPHTLSLHASNAQTTTLQGASRGHERTLWGFEFTVPLTLARYVGGRAGAPPAPPAGDSVAAHVSMTNRLTFAADTVRIRAGQAVRWTNDSALMHTVTADPEQAAEAESVRLPRGAEPFDSGPIESGQAWVYTFTVPGEYRYFCTPHELAGMVGTVIVAP
ncbi:MAG TPA: plastocyanin/azurin family copper-binding protein [Longimicrobiales bacterium]|nr:plastocyanin/azurin family copper-binding protein [Longimicrobiales bacterium]